MVMAIASNGYCENANNWGNTDINPLLSRELPYDLVYLGFSRNGVSLVTSGITAIPLSYSVVRIANTGSRSMTLANSIPGKVLQIQCYSGGPTGNVITITPATSTGWSSATMNTLGHSLTLRYIDDTIGWIVVGYYGATITGS